MPDTLTYCLPERYLRGRERLRSDDYTLARTRASKGHRGDPYRDYAVATHFAKVIANRPRAGGQSVASIFREHVERWKNEVGHLSSITKAIAHPSYLRIIGLSAQSTRFEVERLLLQELESEPDYWFAALTAITGENPVMPEQEFDEAVAAWLTWGRERGII